MIIVHCAHDVHCTRSFLGAGFRPHVTLLFDLYHYLEQNGVFGLVSEHAQGPSSQVLHGCRVRHPICFKEILVRIHIRHVQRRAAHPVLVIKSHNQHSEPYNTILFLVW